MRRAVVLWKLKGRKAIHHGAVTEGRWGPNVHGICDNIPYPLNSKHAEVVIGVVTCKRCIAKLMRGHRDRIRTQRRAL